MKITLKLSPQQLSTLVYSFQVLTSLFSNDSRAVKVSRCILDKVRLKCRKKHLESQQNPKSFTNSKKISFSLEFHEAHYLEEFISIVIQQPQSDYDRNILRYIQTKLDQKLK
jgi:hypothetical protein